MRVLVAGITGFVGGQLLPELIAAGHEVVGLSRNPDARSLGVPVLHGDAVTGEGLQRAMRGVDVAYYLVHSFEQKNTEDVAARDRRAATLFASAAQTAGVRRIVYCGVSPAHGSTSPTAHRRTRDEVGGILASAVPESVCIRTWTILSPANQFVRFLVHLLRRRKVVALPPSARFRSQPIDGRDLALALTVAASKLDLAGATIDVVGPTAINSAQLCAGLCEKLGLKRRILMLPFKLPDILLAGEIRGARLDPKLILSALSSAHAGDVLPEPNFLPRLVASPRSLDTALTYAVGPS